MTTANKPDTLFTTSEGRIFYVRMGFLVGAEKLTVFLVSTERSPFLLGDVMPKGFKKDGTCSGKVFQKGGAPWNKGTHIVNSGCFKKGHVPVGVKFGKDSCNWKGGRVTDATGYILVMSKEHPYKNYSGYIREHRLVVERQIGRHLIPGEEVHHLGTRDDNRPQMLMAFISKGTHSKFESKGFVKPEEIVFDGRELSKEARQ